jgi:hypothetical protein
MLGWNEFVLFCYNDECRRKFLGSKIEGRRFGLEWRVVADDPGTE